jgi:hypothetical protein
VRDVLESDLRRSDPDRYAEVHHLIREHLLDQRRLAMRPDRLINDFIYLHRGSSIMSSYWDWATFGTLDAGPLLPGEEPELVDLAVAHLGQTSGPIVAHWLRRRPDAVTVVRDADGAIRGFIVALVIDEPTGEDRTVDPVLAAVWAHATRRGALRAGQVVSITRFFVDRHAGTGISPTFNVVASRCVKTWLLTPNLALDYEIGNDAALWGPLLEYLDFRRVPEVDTRVGEHTFCAFVHDWRSVGPAAWLDLMETREVGGPVAATAPPPTPVALDRDEFTAAVRAALRDLSRPDRLAANPLLDARVVHDTDSAGGVAALARLLADGFAVLPAVPRTDKALRALDRTYFHGAVSQEAAAEVLDMSFSTYRRHLATGIDLLVETLWHWELYGRDDEPTRISSWTV